MEEVNIYFLKMLKKLIWLVQHIHRILKQDPRKKVFFNKKKGFAGLKQQFIPSKANVRPHQSRNGSPFGENHARKVFYTKN